MRIYIKTQALTTQTYPCYIWRSYSCSPLPMGEGLGVRVLFACAFNGGLGCAHSVFCVNTVFTFIHFVKHPDCVGVVKCRIYIKTQAPTTQTCPRSFHVPLNLNLNLNLPRGEAFFFFLPSQIHI